MKIDGNDLYFDKIKILRLRKVIMILQLSF